MDVYVCLRANAITRCWQSLGGLEKQMLNFLENHDEQRIASDFFARDPRKAIPALVVSSCMNTNPFMIYSGQELGEKGMDTEGFSGRDGRTSIFPRHGAGARGASHGAAAGGGALVA